MLQCIEYEDTIFTEARIFVQHGQFGKAYIISPRDVNMIKEINVSFPLLQSWFENGCVKLYSMNAEDIYAIPKHMPWNLIQGWCSIGAHMDFWHK